MPNIKNYSFPSGGVRINVKNSNFGVINYISAVNRTGTNLTNDIRIGNNSATVESTSNNGLNRSANVTLYGLPTTFINPIIFKNGIQCTDCYNFTSLNAGTVKFNVSSWSNYSIGEADTTAPSLNIIYPANTTYNINVSQLN